MLVEGQISKKLQNFVNKVNALPVKDQKVAIKAYCDNMEKMIYDAIKNVQITIPAGAIVVAGTGGAATNANPIVIENRQIKLIK